MSIPWSLRSRSFATARACSAASSHSPAVFSISGLNTKMCSCISVRPSRSPSTGPRTVLTWAIGSPCCSPPAAGAGDRSGVRMIAGRGDGAGNVTAGPQPVLPRGRFEHGAIGASPTEGLHHMSAPGQPSTPARETEPGPGCAPSPAARSSRRPAPRWSSGSWWPTIGPAPVRRRTTAPRLARPRRRDRLRRRASGSASSGSTSDSGTTGNTGTSTGSSFLGPDGQLLVAHGDLRGEPPR